MPIIGANRKTLNLMREMGFGVSDDIALNMGISNPSFEQAWSGKTWINKPEAVRGNVDKFSMLEKLEEAGVNVPYFERITSERQLRQALGTHNALVFKPDNKIIRDEAKLRNIVRNRGLANKYYTRFVQHDREFRVIIYKNKIVKLYEKLRLANSFNFMWKIKRCEFKEVSWKENKAVYREAKKAVKVMGLDLCGVDVIEDSNGKPVVLETNSAMGMRENTIKKLALMDRNFNINEEWI